MRVFIEDSFDSAHWLPNVPEGHKCRRLHGHTYRVRIEVGGPINKSTGFITDYADVKKAWDGVKAELDHYCLNDVVGLQNPTNELIAKWVWMRLVDGGLRMARLEIRETEQCGVVIE